MKRSRIIYFFLFVLMFADNDYLHAQNLEVVLSPDKSKVDRSTTNGIATIFFESSIQDLSIICTEGKSNEPINKLNDNIWYTHIDVNSDLELDGVCYRKFLLKGSEFPEYELTTDEILPNQVLYYTVALVKKFPKTFSAEWLISSRSQKGFRISYGGRYGVLLGYTWGDYNPSGDNIDDVVSDCDLTYAKPCGYIKRTIFGGLRIGLYQKKECLSYLNVGLGYGEYGRQWENKSRLENSRFFYSDYIKGVNVNSSMSLNYKTLYISFGGDMIMNKGKFMMDWQLGLGIAIGKNK